MSNSGRGNLQNLPPVDRHRKTGHQVEGWGCHSTVKIVTQICSFLKDLQGQRWKTGGPVSSDSQEILQGEMTRSREEPIEETRDQQSYKYSASEDFSCVLLFFRDKTDVTLAFSMAYLSFLDFSSLSVSGNDLRHSLDIHQHSCSSSFLISHEQTIVNDCTWILFIFHFSSPCSQSNIFQDNYYSIYYFGSAFQFPFRNIIYIKKNVNGVLSQLLNVYAHHG